MYIGINNAISKFTIKTEVKNSSCLDDSSCLDCTPKLKETSKFDADNTVQKTNRIGNPCKMKF